MASFLPSHTAPTQEKNLARFLRVTAECKDPSNFYQTRHTSHSFAPINESLGSGFWLFR